MRAAPLPEKGGAALNHCIGRTPVTGDQGTQVDVVESEPEPMRAGSAVELHVAEFIDAEQADTAVAGEAKGLIERHPHPKDQRAMLLAPTDQGMATVNAANRAVENADDNFFATLGASGIGPFVSALATLSRSEASTSNESN